MRRGLVLGCGGPIGFAWSAVALAAVERELGWDARDADVIQGTSAGAELAALLGAGISVAAILAALDAVESGAAAAGPLAARLRQEPPSLPPLPRPALPALGLVLAGLRGRVDATAALAGLLPAGRGDAAFLRTLAGQLVDGSGWVSHPTTRLVAADLGSGALTAFGAVDAPPASLADALAASWAIPGWYPPVPIGGRRYVDGGVVSPTSAHLLVGLGLDEVVLVAPMSTRGGAPARGAARAERVLRRAMTRRVDREIAVLEADGTRVLRIEPGPAELAAMGANFTDVRHRAATLRAARTARSANLLVEGQR